VFRNAHAAIWVTAFIFSAMHMEFFGFVPRLLLGALLGYLVRWSGSLWLPILAHALNNSLVVICLWIEQLTGNPIAIGKIGEGVTTGDWLAAVVSLVVFGWLLARLSSLSGVKTVKDC
jgi:hypothetical protein